MITALISTFGGTIILVIGWLLGGRQKATAELKKTNADATITIQTMYQTFALQYEAQYNALILDVSSLRKEVIELNFRNGIIREASEVWEKKFNDLQIISDEKINGLQKESFEREQKINELQKEHDALKKAFETLKKSIK